jgi:hypothetical protein
LKFVQKDIKMGYVRIYHFWDEAKNYRKLFMHLLPIDMTIGGDKRKNEKTNISNFSYRCGDNRSSYSKYT